MKIIKLSINNVKGIEAAEVEANGNHVVLSGPNAAGKSSVLDSIIWCLTGKGVTSPVREGADVGAVKVDLGDYVVSRAASADGKPARLTVTTKDGDRKASPATWLKDLVGSGLAFDPLAFDRMPPREQRAMLVEACGIDIDDLERKHEVALAKQRGAKDAAKSAEVALSGMADPIDMDEPERTTDLIAQLRDARQRANDLRAAEASVTRTEGWILDARVQEEDLQQELDSLRAEIGGRIKKLEDHKAEAARLASEQTDVGAIEEKVGQASESYRQWQDNESLRARKAEATHRKETADSALHAAAKAVVAARKAKAAALKGADLPVDGMEIAKSGIEVAGVPYQDLNTATRLRIGFAIAARQKTQPRVVLIDEGSALDKAHMAEMLDLATAEGVQVFVTRVADDGDLGFEIVETQAVRA